VGPKKVGITAPRHRPNAARTIAQRGQKKLPLDHGWSPKKLPLWGQKRLLQTHAAGDPTIRTHVTDRNELRPDTD